MRGRSRRLSGILVVAVAGGLAAAPAGAASAQRDVVVRKAASDLTRAEIDRFRRAFSYAVRKGYFDAFSAEHFDATRNRHHGADVLATAPPAVTTGELPVAGHRLLPWHRAFIIEAEKMLRAALRERNRREGRSPREARRLFIPYWNAADEQDLPRWVRRFKPRGGRAIVPEGLPEGHAASGRRGCPRAMRHPAGPSARGTASASAAGPARTSSSTRCLGATRSAACSRTRTSTTSTTRWT